MNNNQRQAYFKRLRLSEVDVTFAGLKALQEQHMKRIPFENLDVVVGRDIILSPDQLFRKIVEEKRGGYCFELNLLFASLLRSLGFEPKPVMGRVWLRNPKQMPPRNHLAHLLKLEGRTYLTDVGFGALAPRVPLNIHSNHEIEDGDGVVRVINTQLNEYMVQRKVDGLWENQYSFEDIDISHDDIEIASFYMSKSKFSHFYHHRFVGIFTENGRMGLFENKLTRRVGINTLESTEILTQEEWLTVLKDRFDLEPNFSEVERFILFSKDEC